MKSIINQLKDEKKQLKKVVETVKKGITNQPKGNLRIVKTKYGVAYYCKDESCAKKSGRYLKKSESQIAKAIAQRDFESSVVKKAEKRIKAIEDFLLKYEKTSIKSVYEETSEYRRALIETDIISDEEYVRRWKNVEYSGKSFTEDAPEIITEHGERVRSKSEKIIADKLYALKIPYRYEYPLLLEGNIKIHPDFTILKMPERKEVYLEHFGMIDDEDYADNMLYKLDTYERNGIYLGVNLFMTHETSNKPLNTRVLSDLLKKLFCD